MSYVNYIKYPPTREMRRKILNEQLNRLLWAVGELVILMIAVPVALLASILLGVLEQLLAPLKPSRRAS
jgi:uncharacterized BrkB/YihY/UPF0761 family membrane protein